MKAIVCEMCNSNNIVKQDGYYVCQHCGTKYSVEEAKKLLIEIDGPVSVIGTVKIDSENRVASLLRAAKRMADEKNYKSAADYCKKVLDIDPNDWEATYFLPLYEIMQSKYFKLPKKLSAFGNQIHSVVQLIWESEKTDKEKVSLFNEISVRTISLCTALFSAVMKQLSGNNIRLREECVIYISGVLYELGDRLNEFLSREESYDTYRSSTVSELWKLGVLVRAQGMGELDSEYIDKIRQFFPEYSPPETKNRGCYVATAIYGSYDCPQVWTLRRYRDYTLAETWYGRAFIRTYYAISPTLVKWFGKTEWFKNLWEPKLDRLVDRLNRDGVENTPYSDRDW